MVSIGGIRPTFNNAEWILPLSGFRQSYTVYKEHYLGHYKIF
jgi:phosphoglucomutase